MLRREVTADVIDDALAATFPASDPPPWTPGIVRLPPGPAARAVAVPNRPAATPRRGETTRIETPLPPPAGGAARIEAPSRAVVGDPTCQAPSATPSERTNLRALMSLSGAVAVVFVFPLAILGLVLPFALAARGVLEAGRWLATFIW